MKKIKFATESLKSFFKKNIKALKKKNIKITKKSIIIIGIALLLMPIGVTFGRYAYIEIRDFYFASKNFYFNSDKLDSNMARYQVDNWSGAESYPIQFNMNSYKNNNEVSTSDIAYNITYKCSDNVICEIDKTEGMITAEKHTDVFTVTIIPNAIFEDGDTVWLEVTANSTSPYEKTISGRFVLKVGKIGTTYEIVDQAGSPYFDLNVTNTLDYYLVKEEFGSYQVGTRLDISTYLELSEENKAKCSSVIINLAFNPNIVILDMTNEQYLKATNVTQQTIGNYRYVNGFSFKVDALSSSVVRFYKSDTTKNYTYPFVSNNSIVTVTYD